MSLYPSLEDMKVDQLQQAQRQYEQATQSIQYPTQGVPQYPSQGYPTAPAPGAPMTNSLYPALDEYMGLQLTPEFVTQNMPLVAQNMQVATTRTGSSNMQVAPVSGNDKGIKRAEIKQGIRELVCCKDQEGKIGLRIRDVNKGLFVALVQNNSPAALAGLRFGDQILQINGENVAGWDTDKAHKVLKKASGERITFAVRDRGGSIVLVLAVWASTDIIPLDENKPFERTITLQKDSHGYIGFIFKDGRIKSLVKDSSACRNGLLTEHQLIEVNGQNVVGVKDEQISAIIDAGGRTVTVTIMPCFLYDHIIKCMGNSIVKKLMDHSIPDV